MRRIFALLLFPFVLFWMTGCQPDANSILGGNMHDGDRLKASYDTTFHIEAFSVPDDSIILQNASWVLLGSSYSNVFGSASYNLVVQLLMIRTEGEDDAYSVGKISSTPHIDSVVLYLPYAGFSPNHSRMDGRPLRLSVYKLDEREKLVDGRGFDSAYSSHYELEYEPILVSGPVTLHPRPGDTSSSTGDGPVLKITLDKNFGEELLDIVRNRMSEGEWEDMESFTRYFKGLYIKCDSVKSENEDIVFSVTNIFASGAMLRVYHDGYLMDEEKGEYYQPYQSFILGPLRFTQVKRNRNVSTDEDYKSQMSTAYDTVHGGKKLFLEGSGGSRIRFKLPDFADVLRDSATGEVKKVVLNRAVVVLTDENAGKEPDITVPRQLVCFKYVNRGTEESLPSEVYADGYYNKTTGQYKINITRYLQQILYRGTVDPANYDEFNTWVDIVPSSDERYEEPCRAVFAGPKAGGNRAMHLEVIYTVVNE